MSIWIIFVIAISLSMDAFSLSLAYGTLNLPEQEIRLLSAIVGGYHFFMPLFGMMMGSLLFSIIPLNPSFVVCIVLCFIGIQMIIESKKEESAKKMRKAEMFLFGLAVSIDSFSVGIGLKSMTDHIIVSAILFSLSSFLFTRLGLVLGKKAHQKLGSISTLLGGIVLIVLGLIYLK